MDVNNPRGAAYIGKQMLQPSGSHLNFVRQDGYATKTINRPLSAEGARLVEDAIIKVLEGEDERYAAEQEAIRQQMEAAKVEAWRQQQAQNMANYYPRSEGGAQ